MAEPSVKGAGLRSLDEVFEDEDLTLSFRAFLHSIGSAHYLSLFVEIELLQMMDDADDFQLQYASSTHFRFGSCTGSSSAHLREAPRRTSYTRGTCDPARSKRCTSMSRPAHDSRAHSYGHPSGCLWILVLPRALPSNRHSCRGTRRASSSGALCMRRTCRRTGSSAGRSQVRAAHCERYMADLSVTIAADQKTTKEATFTKLFRLIVGKELRDSGDKSVPANVRHTLLSSLCAAHTVRPSAHPHGPRRHGRSDQRHAFAEAGTRRHAELSHDS